MNTNDNVEKLREILYGHKKWLNNKGGIKAGLSSAKTDKRHITISCIGSRKDSTTYCFEDGKIWCWCFTGTLEEFKKKILENILKKKIITLKNILGL